MTFNGACFTSFENVPAAQTPAVTVVVLNTVIGESSS